MIYFKDYIPTEEETQKTVNAGVSYWLDIQKKCYDIRGPKMGLKLVSSIISYLDENKKLSPKQAKVLLFMEQAVNSQANYQQ